MKIKKSDFLSKGVRCDGDLFLPEKAQKPPAVIMAHGLAAQKDFRLPAFAQRFVQEKMAVFLFDYRTFGKSDGMPRQTVDPFRHVEDWQAAIAHVRSLPDIDAKKIALWGTSFSGGHVITYASHDNDISAIVSQVPFVSSFSSLRLRSLTDIFLSTTYGIYDLIRAGFSLSPHYSPVIANPGSFAAMNTAESYQGYMSIAAEGSNWENKMASRAFMKISFYSPLSKAHQVKAPTLVMAGRYDSLIPLDAVEKLAKKLPVGELIVMDCSHFEPYTGEFFERFVAAQRTFLKKHLF